MRFSSILAATTMVLLSVVSAQTMPDPSVVAACNTCIANAGIAAVPVCKGLENSKVDDPKAATDKQKACWCGLVANKTWIEGCIGSDKCPASAVESLRKSYEASVAAPGTCDSVSTSANDGSRFGGASSIKVAAAGAAAVAIAGAFL